MSEETYQQAMARLEKELLDIQAEVKQIRQEQKETKDDGTKKQGK